MENASKAVEDTLIPAVNFRLDPGASYITGRRFCTFFPQGGNSYSPSGVKQIRINLSSEYGWLDPQTLRLQFTVVNDSAGTTLRTISGGWSFVSRARLLCGGQVLEDIGPYYNRTHEMFHVLTGKDVRDNDELEGSSSHVIQDQWANPAECEYTGADRPGINQDTKTRRIRNTNPMSVAGYESWGKRTMLWRPLFGLLNQEKYIPLRYSGGLTLELEIVNDFFEPIITDLGLFHARVGMIEDNTAPGTAAPNAPPANTRSWSTQNVKNKIRYPTDGNNPPAMREVEIDWTDTPTFGNANRWHIEDVQVKADIVNMDSQFEEKFASHMRTGGSLDINFQSYVNQSQQIVGRDVTVQVMRAFSKLKCLFVTLDNQNCRIQNPNQDVVERGMTKFRSFLKPWNLFYHPCAKNYGYYWHEADLELQVNIGNTIFPDIPIRSQPEFFYNLRKTLGIAHSNYHSLDIKSSGIGSYHDSKFIIGIDTEKTLQAAWTGIETKSGSLMHIKMKLPGNPTLASYLDHTGNPVPNLSCLTANNSSIATMCHIVLVPDLVVKLYATGAILLE